MSNARSLIEKSKDFVDLASSAQVSTKIPPAISAALISIIYSLEAVNVQHRPCDATLPEPAVAESLPTSEPGVKLSGHFWPDLKKQLFALPADEAWVHPDLDCPVCREKMAFVGAYTLDGGLTTASAHALAALHSHGMEAASWAEDVLLLLLVICGDLVRPLMTTSEFVQRAGRKKIRSVKRKNLDELGAHYAAYRRTSLKKLEDLMAAARVKLRHVEEGMGMTWALDLWA
ncbi:Helicase swr-1 [Verticillium dahliae VDG2]|nr:Helicase swr-1 [Verticillium dahliae VDG2]